MDPVDNMNVLNGYNRMNMWGNQDNIFSNKNGISRTSPVISREQEDSFDTQG